MLGGVRIPAALSVLQAPGPADKELAQGLHGSTFHQCALQKEAFRPTPMSERPKTKFLLLPFSRFDPHFHVPASPSSNLCEVGEKSWIGLANRMPRSSE